MTCATAQRCCGLRGTAKSYARRQSLSSTSPMAASSAPSRHVAGASSSAGFQATSRRKLLSSGHIPMTNHDDGVPEDWYPGYYLDPRNAWKWMPSAIPGWLPPAMVRTPPTVWPEQTPEPSGSSTPGLLDGLAEF